jgi:HK97 family phage major capsid protein
MVVSLEAFDDLESSFTAVGLITKFMADRLARGISYYLVNGAGAADSQPMGLLTALNAANAQIVTATGSATNDGGTGTGANSLGSLDLANCLSELDAAYLNEHTAWLMNQHTLGTLSGMLDKYGNIVKLVHYLDDGTATIYGIPVQICPSMPSIGSSNQCVLLGDLSYFAVRLVSPIMQRFTEAPGLAENGKIAFRTFMRADSGLLWSPEPSSPAGASAAPFVILANHS